MSSTVLIEPLPVIEFVNQLLNRDISARPLSHSDRVKACKFVDGQRYSKRLNERQNTALLKVTCQHPNEREKDILKTVGHNAYAQDPMLTSLG
ncbi:ARGONAUTE 1 [Artemisia annua]|uniref:ARGONAUTE 1 n=1 Tax=Artemisia annua TaxID=35608 RepID=A0A2U1MRF1_ARTAN|nr:ARGONAUTE 1 [Artemisia annua]